MTAQEQWTCTKCHGQSVKTGVIRTTGGGLSRFLNVQTHKFEYISCVKCGYTDLFRVAEKGAGWRNVLDAVIDS